MVNLVAWKKITWWFETTRRWVRNHRFLFFILRRTFHVCAVWLPGWIMKSVDWLQRSLHIFQKLHFRCH